MSELLGLLSSSDSSNLQPLLQKLMVNAGLSSQKNNIDTDELGSLGNFLLNRYHYQHMND